jgi:UDP-glucose-4-epimerase GalE
MATLITGGAGYIGFHIVCALAERGEHVIAVDDLSAGVRPAMPARATLIVGDCGDQKLMAELVRKHQVSAIIHVAGAILVADSMQDPLSYYRSNAVNTCHLIEVAMGCGVRSFVFSSSAAVYGDSDPEALSEDALTQPISPYGKSQLMAEIMLRDVAAAQDLKYVVLRVFNVVGADSRISTPVPGGHPSSLINKAIGVALGLRPWIEVYGTDYPTADGTCVRDYVHVSDVARAYCGALDHLRQGSASATFDCGCGRGLSVREVAEAVARACGRDLPIRYFKPRPGDAVKLVADTQRIRSVLGWTPQFEDFDAIVAHALALERHRLERRTEAANAFLRIVSETGIPADQLQKLISGFGHRSHRNPPPPPPFAGAQRAETRVLRAPYMKSRPTMDNRKLTIGMATYDDYDGAYFTLQAIRMYHPEILDDVDFVVVDNNPNGPCGQALQDLVNWVPNYRYVPKGDVTSTAIRDWVFREASGRFVLCVDSHILIVNGALRRLIEYVDRDPNSLDLLQGPLIYDDLKNYSTHFRPEWRAGMFGTWDTDPAGSDPDRPPFEIPMQGLGLFACRRSAWPGFNPEFRGFGGEEGYIHEKIRQRGGKVLCLPFLRWMHRFGRPLGASYAVRWEDRVRNYLIGFREVGWDATQVVQHFRAFLGEEAWSTLSERLGPDILPPISAPTETQHRIAEEAQQSSAPRAAEQVDIGAPTC